MFKYITYFIYASCEMKYTETNILVTQSFKPVSCLH